MHALFKCKNIYYHHLNYPNDVRIRFAINDEWMNEHKSHERDALVFFSRDVEIMELLNNNYIWILNAPGAGNGQNECIDKCYCHQVELFMFINSFDILIDAFYSNVSWHFIVIIIKKMIEEIVYTIHVVNFSSKIFCLASIFHTWQREIMACCENCTKSWNGKEITKKTHRDWCVRLGPAQDFKTSTLSREISSSLLK